MSTQNGLEIVTEACTDNAKDKKSDRRLHYEGDYEKAYRVFDDNVEKNCWLGYMYINNKHGSGHQLKETLQFDLDDIKLISAHKKEKVHGKKIKEVLSELDSGDSKLILFRSKDNKGTVKLKSLVHPREITESELTAAVMDDGETREIHPEYLSVKERNFKNHLGIYLENNSKELNLNVTLSFYQLNNMQIDGHEEAVSEVTLNVPARSKDTFVMVKPINVL
jgi:hypothetical protein